ncbi:MAG: C45 family autoproteolytic acyltransferase/hydrolase [Armatimonadetes bacterium]|nr:C45 family autoproteolytic acyltransferase/hydrolase [Armatimonadota bacterium]
MLSRTRRTPRLALAATIVLTALAVVLPGCGGSGGGGNPGVVVGHARITNCGAYYNVTLDFTGTTPRQVGADYGQAIKAIKPDFEAQLDTFLADMLGGDAMFAALLHRVDAIKPQLDASYREEIEGIASSLSGGSTDKLGDGQLSLNELYMVNLNTDALRPTQCSFTSVWGQRSATRRTISARVLDWPDGPTFPMAKCQAVVHYVNGAKSVYTIGYLGYQGMLTGINSQGVFGAVLDSPSWAPFPDPPTGYYSYSFDLRHALENQQTLDGVASAMTAHPYTFCHNIALSDPSISRILENDQTPGHRRALRSDTSALRSGVTWGISNAVASVNSFLLPENVDNHSQDVHNVARWESIVTQLKSKGITVDRQELTAVEGYYKGSIPGKATQGDVFSVASQMLVIFQPSTKGLDIAFHPHDGDWAGPPTFTSVPVTF